jgi:hypothetical protein
LSDAVTLKKAVIDKVTAKSADCYCISLDNKKPAKPDNLRVFELL